MTPEMANELDFIVRRVRWLEEQPRVHGVLTDADHRDEAGIIYGRIEELETLLEAA